MFKLICLIITIIGFILSFFKGIKQAIGYAIFALATLLFFILWIVEQKYVLAAINVLGFIGAICILVDYFRKK